MIHPTGIVGLTLNHWPSTLNDKMMKRDKKKIQWTSSIHFQQTVTDITTTYTLNLRLLLKDEGYQFTSARYMNVTPT